MRVRYVIPILAVLLIIGGLTAIKAQQIGTLIAAGAAAEKAGPPPESVSTTVAKADSWETTLSAVGTVEAVRGVTISNEASGMVRAIHFESGAAVKAGQVLVELDTAVERAQLASAEARKELAGLTLTRSKALVASSSLPGAQLETDESVLKSADADSASIRAQIDRKIVRAPFSGRLGIRGVNLGQYLSPGTPITVLESVDQVFVDFTLPQQRLGDVPVGTPVRMTVEGVSNFSANGTISAVDPTVDQATRMARMRAAVANPEEKLRPGMFVNVQVVQPHQEKVVSVPATAVVHASYGASLFIVEQDSNPGPDGKPGKVARQQFVKLGPSRGDFVSITEGLKPDTEIVSAGAFKLRNGARIAINNDIKLNPQISPRPDNR